MLKFFSHLMFNVYYHIIEFCDFILCWFVYLLPEFWVCVCVCMYSGYMSFISCDMKIFSLCSLFFFILLTVFFKENSFNFDNVQLSWIMFLVSYLRSLCLPEGHKIFFPIFYFRCFLVLDFVFNLMMHFEKKKCI